MFQTAAYVAARLLSLHTLYTQTLVGTLRFRLSASNLRSVAYGWCVH
mgnify:CR=1 FL=1